MEISNSKLYLLMIFRNGTIQVREINNDFKKVLETSLIDIIEINYDLLSHQTVSPKINVTENDNIPAIHLKLTNEIQYEYCPQEIFTGQRG